MWRLELIILAVLLGSCARSLGPQPARRIDWPHQGTVSLSGQWQFQLDPRSAGEKEQWFAPDHDLSDVIQVPGCWDAQGKGVAGAITTVANADDTQPNVRALSAYNGEAWYRRTFEVPPAWRGKVVWLHVGGVNDRAKLWINGKEAGEHDGYCTGFKINVSHSVRFDGPNVCAIRVSNAPRPEGNLEGGMDFYTNWGGIYRDVWLEATEQTWIERMTVTPDLAGSAAKVEMRILTHWQGQAATTRVKLHVLDADGREVARDERETRFQSSGSAQFTASLPIARVKLWSPNLPYLYRLRAEIVNGEKVVDAVEERFGMREIHVEGKQIFLNRRPIFLRGYGDGCIYPLTISPPASKEHYLRELRRAKEYGFNFARHHTWVPTPEHLEAADEVGILMQVELPTGLHPIVQPSEFLFDLWRNELKRVVEANANHPSVIIYAMGNELGDALKSDQTRAFYFDLTSFGRSLDAGRLFVVTSGSTTPLPPEEPFYDRGIYNIEPLVADAKAVAGWVAGHDRPYVWHEMGYYASYPDVSLRGKYNGGAVPFWLDNALKVAKAKGFDDRLPLYVRNSVRLQQICRKWEMELARKTALAGYQWWTFKDDSWATEGIVDDFCDAKPGADAAAIRRINADDVLLLEREPRTTRAGETLTLKVQLSHFGLEPINDISLKWELRGPHGIEKSGSAPGLTVQQYGLSDLAQIEMKLPQVQKPGKYVLHLSLGNSIENEWTLWVFPKPTAVTAAVYDPSGSLKVLPDGAHSVVSAAEVHDGVLIATMLPAEVVGFIENGGRVLLISRKQRTGLPERPCALESPDIPYPIYFAPTYWGAPAAPGGGNLGTVVADHPALGDFPHEGFCDLQFLSLLHGVNRADLEALPVKIDPIIRSITDWRIGAGAAYLYEVQVGKGRLMVTTLNFEQALTDRKPEAEYLLAQLVSYCASGEHKPAAQLEAGYLRRLSSATH